jgi:hypothetical protein
MLIRENPTGREVPNGNWRRLPDSAGCCGVPGGLSVSDHERRTSLMTDWTAADASLRNAVASIHSFDQASVDTRLAESRNQIARLFAVTGR